MENYNYKERNCLSLTSSIDRNTRKNVITRKSERSVTCFPIRGMIYFYFLNSQRPVLTTVSLSLFLFFSLFFFVFVFH